VSFVKLTRFFRSEVHRLPINLYVVKLVAKTGDHLRGSPTLARPPDMAALPFLIVTSLRFPESKNVHLCIWTMSWVKAETHAQTNLRHHSAHLRNRYHTLSSSTQVAFTVTSPTGLSSNVRLVDKTAGFGAKIRTVCWSRGTGDGCRLAAQVNEYF